MEEKKTRNKKTYYPNRVMFRCSDEILEKVDKKAQEWGLTRSKTIRRIVESGLK